MAMRSHCPNCGLQLDRGESDYFYGAYLLNFVAAELFAIFAFVVGPYHDVAITAVERADGDHGRDRDRRPDRTLSDDEGDLARGRSHASSRRESLTGTLQFASGSTRDRRGAV